MIVELCTRCNKRHELPDSQHNKQFKCTRCGEKLQAKPRQRLPSTMDEFGAKQAITVILGVVLILLGMVFYYYFNVGAIWN